MASLQAIGVVLVCLGGVVALLNWLSLVQTWSTGRFSSPIPLIGGAFLGGGMLLVPSTRPYAWAGVFADYGTLALLPDLPRIIDEVWSTSRYNLVEEYVGDRGIKTVYLRLFRKGVFTIEQPFRRQAGECGLLRAGTIGKWERKGDRLVLRLDDRLRQDGRAAEFEPLATIEPAGVRQVLGFPDYESNGDLSLADIELRLRYKRAEPGAAADRPRD
jgi:hypothetical protein